MTRLVNAVRKGAYGLSRVSTTVSWSGVSNEVTAFKGDPNTPTSLAERFKDETTASAVTCWPLWNVAPSTRSKVKTVASGLTS